MYQTEMFLYVVTIATRNRNSENDSHLVAFAGEDPEHEPVAKRPEHTENGQDADHRQLLLPSRVVSRCLL